MKMKQQSINNSANVHHHHNQMEELLMEMRLHVSNLQDKLHVANSAVNKGQNVNGKIALMKEYQEKVASLNSCWRTKNRAQLMSNLQHENRQIMALEEENRQLRLALKELEDGMHLIMSDYRRVCSDFMRADLLSNLAESQQKNTFLLGIDHGKFIGMARATEKYMEFSDKKATEDQALITQLISENKTLRLLLHSFSVPTTNSADKSKEDKPMDLITNNANDISSQSMKMANKTIINNNDGVNSLDQEPESRVYAK